MSAVLAFPDMQASQPFDLDFAIRDVLAERMTEMRARQAYASRLHNVIETTRLFRDRACANGSEAMAELASMERDRVDDVFDQRPRQSARIAEQTMRSLA